MITKQTTQYFRDFTPYTLPVGLIAADTVGNMISYSFPTPSPEVNLSYVVGAKDTYGVNMDISNITENATLDVEVIVDTTIFTVVSQPTFSLTPKQTKVVTIALNKDSLNTMGDSTKSTSIQIKVTNRNSGVQVVRDVNTPLVPQQQFPSTIDIK